MINNNKEIYITIYLLKKFSDVVKLFELFREFFKMILRVIKLSFLIKAVDKIGDITEDVSEENSIKFSPKGFLKVVKIFRVLYVRESFSLSILKYFFIYDVMISFPLVDPSEYLIFLIIL